MIIPVYRTKASSVSTGERGVNGEERFLLFDGELPRDENVTGDTQVVPVSRDLYGKYMGGSVKPLNQKQSYFPDGNIRKFKNIGDNSTRFIYPRMYGYQSALGTSHTYGMFVDSSSFQLSGDLDKTNNTQDVECGVYYSDESTGIVTAIYSLYHTTVIGFDVPLSPPPDTRYTFFHNSFSYFTNKDIVGVYGVIINGEKSVRIRNALKDDRTRFVFDDGFTLRDGDTAELYTEENDYSLLLACDIIITDLRGAHPYIFGVLKEGEEYEKLSVVGTDRRLVANTFNLEPGDKIVVCTPTDLPYTPAYIYRDFIYNYWFGVDADIGKHSIIDSMHGRSWDVWETPTFPKDVYVTVAVYFGDSL